jgi:hypothetical protein
MKPLKNDLFLHSRDTGLCGSKARIPHIHRDGFNPVQLLLRKLAMVVLKAGFVPVFKDSFHRAPFHVTYHGLIRMSLGKGYLMDTKVVDLCLPSLPCPQTSNSHGSYYGKKGP